MRNQGGRSWRQKLVLFVLAGSAAGAAGGATLGAAGGLLSADVRAATTVVLAAVGATVAVLGLLGRRVSLPQHDVATPQRWLHQGPVRWALKNGAALGLGATTRIGFALWYVIPAYAVVSAHPARAAAVWSAYGAARTLAAWPMVRLQRRPDGLSVMDRLALRGRWMATRATSGVLLVVCAGSLGSAVAL
jgi:hypothetical protein